MANRDDLSKNSARIETGANQRDLGNNRTEKSRNENPGCYTGHKGKLQRRSGAAIFRREAEIVECLNFEDTFKSVISKKTKYAVVPLKNKIVGEITSATEFLKSDKFENFRRIAARSPARFVGTNDAEIENIKTVRSHIEALKQCRQFLSNNGNLQQIIGADTASSIRRIVEENLSGKCGNRQSACRGNLRRENFDGKYRGRFGQLDDVLSFGKLIKSIIGAILC